MVYLIAAVLAYLIGSFPSGVAVVRLVRGFDVRQVGSRRSGAANVLRSAGVVSAIIVFLLDLLKGAGGVWLGQWLTSSPWVAERWQAWAGRLPAWPLPPEWLSALKAAAVPLLFWGRPWQPVPPEWVLPLWTALLCGLAALAGHNWPVYVRFRGGRGVTTSLGTIIPLAPVVAAGVFLIGVLAIARTRYVSLGSVVGAGLMPLGLLLQAIFAPVPIPVVLYGLLVAGVVIFQHRDNIARLRAGTERRLGEKAEVPPAGQGSSR